tara:strand:- start:118 stop:576 length:459 start_codon:yes stop_codon:yes gene_type:complete
MINYLKLLILFLFLWSPSLLFADENWEFTNAEEYCFIQSSPIKTDIPEGKFRGEHGILVYRMHKSPELIIQITAGFNYKSIDSISVKIDDGEYSFYTDDDTGWAKEDKKVIYAMKKGLELITSGVSSKGTEVIDTYTLKGFTMALNKLDTDC